MKGSNAHRARRAGRTAAFLAFGIAAAGVCAGPSRAQSQPPVQGPVRLSPDGGQRPVVDLSLCQTLTAHQPAPDVEYRPGVDVHGRPVAPADLPGSAGAAPPIPIDLPLSVDLARRMGFPMASAPGLPNDVTAVWLTVMGNRLYLNGQPIEPAAAERLAAYCRSR
ncbi:hypothetical protein [Azospirillum sp. TSO35-2]|uniref:hypothetical protein n=1 Tax=Azospirillum sp. TSO35-2 TaxID=716796 RepID=UPI000D617C5A|nr:hypothetical protein [Azospirillum sp. TSO35-2]PWC34684.1 hypothetical protein TSO352_25620 [Azospirillum sp. TSO35-2]